jgi:hypothetical protein
MHASMNVIRAAELRRLDILAEAARERQVDAALAANEYQAPTQVQPPTAFRMLVRDLRDLLTGLASVTVGLQSN